MFLALSPSDVVFIMLINVKMPTIVGILTFKSRINLVLGWVEHGKSFITSFLCLLLHIQMHSRLHFLSWNPNLTARVGSILFPIT